MRKPRAEIRKKQHQQEEGQPQHDKWTHPVKNQKTRANHREAKLSPRQYGEDKARRRGEEGTHAAGTAQI